MRPQESPEELERRRMRAMRLLREDRPPAEVARMVGIDRRRNVRRWKAADRKRGAVALRAKPAPGSKTERMSHWCKASSLKRRSTKLPAGTMPPGW